MSEKSKYKLSSVKRVFKPSCLGGNLALTFARSMKNLANEELYQKFSPQEIIDMRKKHSDRQIFDNNVPAKNILAKRIQITRKLQTVIRNQKDRDGGPNRMSQKSGYSVKTINRLTHSASIGKRMDIEKGSKLIAFLTSEGHPAFRR